MPTAILGKCNGRLAQNDDSFFVAKCQRKKSTFSCRLFQYLPCFYLYFGAFSKKGTDIVTFNIQYSVAVLFVLVDYDIIKPNMAKESIVELYRYSS